MSQLQDNLNNILNQKNNYLLPKNLKKDITLLGVTGTYEGQQPSGTIYPPDWSELGYENTPQTIIDGFNYAKDIKDNWDSSITYMRRKIQRRFAIKIFPYGRYFKCN